MNERKTKFFHSRKIDDGLTQIAGLAGEKAYLVEGENYALLIDGLTGVGSLKAFVRELTEKPVVMVATHGHMDHVGAAWEYGELFIHPDDMAAIYTDRHTGEERRFLFATTFAKFGVPFRTEPTMADVIPACAIKTYPVYQGDVFDLGGTMLEVIHVPGHTYGSIMLLDRKRRVVFGGDGLNGNTLLNLVESASVEEYYNSLLGLKKYYDVFDGFWNGHDTQIIPKSIVDDGLRLCTMILNRTDDAIAHDDIFGGASLMASGIGADGRPTYGGLCNIQYKEERLLKNATPVITGKPNLRR